MEAAVHGDDLACGFAKAICHEDEIGFGLVSGGDGGFGQSTVGVELRELADQGFRLLIVGVWDVILGE